MTFRQPEFESILTNVSKSISLNTNEIEYFISALQIETVLKKSIILKEGQLCDKITFVCDGILRAYLSDSKGKQSTIMFAVENWWITDMYCFLNAQKAMLFIEAVETSTVIHLSKSNLDNIYLKIPKFEKFFRIIMQNAYVREQLRTIQSLSLTAEHRYENFLKKYPQVAKQVTQKHIASYLGITPEFLSVLRSRRN